MCRTVYLVFVFLIEATLTFKLLCEEGTSDSRWLICFLYLKKMVLSQTCGL